jgi:hypothetical protein
MDEVVIAGSRRATTVTIPWESRQALFARLRPATDTRKIIRTFESARTSGPVRLDKHSKRRLLAACQDWLDETTVETLPEGIYDLLNALIDERDYGDLD